MRKKKLQQSLAVHFGCGSLKLKEHRPSLKKCQRLQKPVKIGVIYNQSSPHRRTNFMNIMGSKLLTMAIFMSVATVVSGAPKAEDEAKRAAEQWLELVDAGDFAGSWNTSAQYFKKTIPQGDWENSLDAVRSTLGDVVSRKLRSVYYTKSIPEGPSGELMVLEFETSFAKRKVAMETVTPMLDKDGNWRVSGYYIKCLAPQ